MSPTVSREQIRPEEIDVTAQNPCTNVRSGSTPLCKILTHGNQLYLKSNETLRLYFENVNNQLTSKNGCK